MMEGDEVPNSLQTKGDEDKWALERGFKFSFATKEDIEELKEFFMENLHNNEPVDKCCEIGEGNGYIDSYVRNLFRQPLLDDPIMKNETGIRCSLIVRKLSDNSIVGCRIGAIYSKEENPDDDLVPYWLGVLPSIFSYFRKFAYTFNYNSLVDDLHYNHKQAFLDLPDTTDLMYFCKVVCVSERARGKGLGKEMIKRALKIAFDAGCKYTYIFATSSYSQKIFHQFDGCKVLHEVEYKDYEYDERGRPFLLDHGIHKVLQILSIDNSLVA